MCSAGIFITVKLSEMFKNKKINMNKFYNLSSKDQVLTEFNEIYCSIFVKFNIFWK